MSPTAETTDDVFRLHAGGKLQIRLRVPLETRADLERVYTPGFTHVALGDNEIAEDVASAVIRAATATGVAQVRPAANKKRKW